MDCAKDDATCAALRNTAIVGAASASSAAAAAVAKMEADAATAQCVVLAAAQQAAAATQARATAVVPAGVAAHDDTDGKAAAASGGSVDAHRQTPHFQVFLSHRRNDARDFARSLYDMFQLRGFTCFLDFEFREELNDLDAIVSGCDNFVFILTEHVFDSSWCMRELRAAVLAGLNIVLVRKDGALWEDEQGVRCHEYPPPRLINVQDEAVRNTLLTSKAVAHSDEYYGSFCEVLVKRLVTPEEAASLRARAQAARRQQHPAAPAHGPPLGSKARLSHSAASAAAARFARVRLHVRVWWLADAARRLVRFRAALTLPLLPCCALHGVRAGWRQAAALGRSYGCCIRRHAAE
jgi:hypothetical protein